MPQGDGTGPNGQGAMTGRGRGFCAGFNMPGFMNPGLGRGRGIGWRARARQFIPIQQATPVITEKQEKELLEQDLKVLKEEMKEIEIRLKEINK